MFNIQTTKVPIWDKLENSLVIKTEVYVQIVGNQGTVFFEEGPLYCTTGQEIFEATNQLKKRLIQNLPMNKNSE